MVAVVAGVVLSVSHLLVLAAFVAIPIAVLAVVVALGIWVARGRREAA